MPTNKALMKSLLSALCVLIGSILICMPGTTHAADAGSGSGAGLASGMTNMVPGQTARLSVWNAGDKDVALRLLIIDGDGKILLLAPITVGSGKASVQDFHWPCCGAVQVHGEIRVDSKQDLDGIAPSLQIIDDATGKSSAQYGPNDFVRFGPIFHPPGE